PPETTDVNDGRSISLFSSDDLRESALQLRDKLEDFCKEEFKKISDRGKVLDSSALRNESIIISYHEEHHIRNVLLSY
ncbi:hypothetical protein M9458_043466, partial [Cirrhinus mrigala]